MKMCSDHFCDASRARISDHNKDNDRCIENDFDGTFVNAQAHGFMGYMGENTKSAKDCDVKCCKNDPTTCRGYDQPGGHSASTGDHNEFGCWPDGQWIEDIGEYLIYGTDGKPMKHANGTYMFQMLPKTTNKVEKDEDYKGQCCTPKVLCEVWKDPSLPNSPPPFVKKAQTSAAKRQQALVAAPLLMAFGVIALSKRGETM
jgi:hypothetical protein